MAANVTGGICRLAPIEETVAEFGICQNDNMAIGKVVPALRSIAGKAFEFREVAPDRPDDLQR
jgi:hypothetical protein